jgi:peptidoglycan hydrolase-like protein with peptidoglycan-binding domain
MKILLDFNFVKEYTMKKSYAPAYALLAGLFAFSAIPAQAADTKHDFAVHGIGALSCADLTATSAKNMPVVRGLLASWLLGYVTAMNRSQTVTYDVTPVQEQGALVNMVAGVCQKHPNVPIETVSYIVLQTLEKAKLSSESPEVTVTVGKASTILRQDTLQRLQKVLVSLQYLDANQATGSFGAKTQDALIKFQTAQNLPKTGLPDPATVVRALVEMKS